MHKRKGYAGIVKKRRKKMKNRKRVLALMLAGVLTLGCFPTTVQAVNNAYDGTKRQTEQQKSSHFWLVRVEVRISESRDLLR